MDDTSTSCRYHRRHPALWHCPACDLKLCRDCRPHAENLPIEVHCPLCRGAMVELHDRPAPQSRWRELLAAPLVRRSLLWLPVLTALVGALPSPLLRWAAGAVAFLLVAAWLVMLARHAAEDRSEPPSLAGLFNIDELEYALQTLWFALPFAVAFALATATASPALYALSMVFTAMLAPAALMSTVMSDSASGMFRAGLIGKLLAATRRDYLAVAVLGLLASALLGLVIQLPGTLWASAAGLCAGFAGGWLSVAWSLAVGELLYRHRRVLDYSAGVDSLDRPRRPAASVYEPALMAADAEILIAEGRKKIARRYLGECLTRFPDDLELNRRFDDLVRESSSKDEYRNHLERRLRRLVGRGQAAGAADIWQRSSAYLGSWTPKTSETRYRLALELDQRGEHAVAFRMLIGLSPKNTGFNHLAEAWLEAARILEQHLDDAPKAAELRRTVMAKYPARARKWLRKWQAEPAPGKRPEPPLGATDARAG